MDVLIPVINKLHDIFTLTGSDGINLPQIVVIGSQSSGKSSVLESIVGRGFLPRGHGIVTRRPLILQLIHVTADTKRPPTQTNDSPADKYNEWAVFLHAPRRIFYNFAEVEAEIVAETERVTGANKGISDVPINLKIYSPNVLDLTLVDLPGMTKVPVGDQPSDVEQLVHQLYLKHITNPKSIILAVSAATADFATSDALKIAREVDPNGVRTLAVITKLDLVDPGTDTSDVLRGKLIPVKLGIIGVINRSQSDLNNFKDMQETISDEADFLQENYALIASRNGTPFLARRLQSLLITHIHDSLPELRNKISFLITKYTALQQSFGQAIDDKARLLLQFLNRFATDYCSLINGNTTNITINELCGGARINFIFNDAFARCLEAIDSLDGLPAVQILTSIRNATGTRNALFVPDFSFELLVKRQIRKFEEPCLQCVDLVHQEMRRIASQCVNELDSLRFPELARCIISVVYDLLDHCMSPTISMVRNLVQIELAYINTRHPYFREVQNIVRPVETSKSRRRPINSEMNAESTEVVNEADPGDSKRFDSLKLSSREKSDCILIERLITSYYKIVRNNIQDSVPKAIMNFLVNYTVENLHSELVNKLYVTDQVDDLLSESDAIKDKRLETAKMIEALGKANRVLGEIKSIQIS